MANTNYVGFFEDSDIIKIRVHDFKSPSAIDMYKTMISTIPGTNTGVGTDKSEYEKVKTAIGAFSESVKASFKADFITYKNSEALTSFIFPCPTSINDHYSQSYEVSEYNLDNKLFQMGLSKMIDGITNNLSAGLGGTISDVVATTEHLSRRGNIGIDPNAMSIYTGSRPRIFTFQFQLIPVSEKNANDILNNIVNMRMYSLGKKDSIEIIDGSSLGIIKSSHIFTFEFMRKDRITGKEGAEYKLNKPLNAMMNTSNGTSGFFLSNIDVSIGSGGDSIQFFELPHRKTKEILKGPGNAKEKQEKDQDGNTVGNTGRIDTIIAEQGSTEYIPKMINISMAFVERRPMYRLDWLAAMTDWENQKGSKKS